MRKRQVHCKPQCSRTAVGQCSSCNQVLWSYKGIPVRFGRRDFLLLEEIRPGYNTVERSSENEYVIPVNHYIPKKLCINEPTCVTLIIMLHSSMI